jgi:Ca-activated chloride channel family protein
VPTHDVAARRPADGTLRMTLAEKDSIPNRDFVLRYRVVKPEPRATLFVGTKDSGQGNSVENGFFSLVVWPPDLDVEELVGQREFVFVVDVSGSMTGLPLSMCKSAMRTALRRIRPVDTFNVLTFSGQTLRAFEASRPANTENVRRALAVVDGLNAGGGTYMADAVAAALGPDIAPGRNRYVFFLTDGYVGNEDAIISASRTFVDKAARNRQRARVFGFGVGSSVNRHLIDGLSRAGDGVAVYATAREDPERAVDRFFHYADRAVLEKLEIDWGGLEVSEPMPKPLPDLFASHAVTLHGRYRGKPGGNVVVRGRARGKTLEIPVRIERSPAELHGARVLGTLWAREKVAFLEQGRAFGDLVADDEIRALGLEFHLVTRFTSLVAVDVSRRVGDGNPHKVIEALDEPEGVDVDMAGGARTKQSSEGSYAYGYEDKQLSEEGDPGARPELLTGPLSASSVRLKRGGCGCRLQDGSRATRWTLLFALGLFGRRATSRYSASTRAGLLARSRAGRSLDAAGAADGRSRPASS